MVTLLIISLLNKEQGARSNYRCDAADVDRLPDKYQNPQNHCRYTCYLPLRAADTSPRMVGSYEEAAAYGRLAIGLSESTCLRRPIGHHNMAAMVSRWIA